MGGIDLVRQEQGIKMQEKETLDERLPGLFEPDTLLPIQYFEAMRRKHLLEGEKRLILSVLEDAVECFMKCIDSNSSKGQRLFRDAEEWINLEDRMWVFSFDNVCEMLDINPEYLRRGLRAWKERRLLALANARTERAERAAYEAEQAAIAALNPPVVEAVETESEPVEEAPVVEIERIKAVAAASKTLRPMTAAKRKSGASDQRTRLQKRA